jgi:hypothetical protein
VAVGGPDELEPILKVGERAGVENGGQAADWPLDVGRRGLTVKRLALSKDQRGKLADPALYVFDLGPGGLQ